jgi:nucleotide-binding universal stress UspA family protein
MSVHSVKALHYAVDFCNELDAELHIITAYQVPKRSSSFLSIKEQIRKNTKEEMDKIIAGISPLIKNDRIPIVRLYRGNAESIILDYSETNDIDMLIMGTQGDNSLRTLLFGSVTKNVAAKSKVPVLAIPETVNDSLQGNKILMALDNQVLEHEDSFQIPKLIASRLGLKIDLLHISREGEDFPFDPYISAYLQDTLGDVNVKNGQDPVTEIKKYAENNNVGMLIMIRREKSFLSKLFKVGNTAEEIAKTNIPLLILPE